MKHANWVRLTGIMLVLSLVLVLCGCKKSQAQTDPTLLLEETVATETTAATTEPTAETKALSEETLATEPTVTEEETQPTISETSPHTHEWKITTKAASCTAGGYTVHTCSICGESYTDSEINALGHQFGSWKTILDATQTSDGKAERTCATCGKVESRVISKLPNNHVHSYTSKVTKQPTCLTPGVKTYTCSCGDTYTDEIARLEHKYVNKVIAPTCEKEGYTEHTCSVCGHSYKDNYELNLGHNFDNVDIAPTCTEKGYTIYTCRRCGYSTKAMFVDARGHDWGGWVTEKAPSIAETGLSARECNSCGKRETKTLPKVEHTHSYTSTVKAPTCTANGYTEYVCACGHSYRNNETQATGHSWGSWQTVVNPTATSTGQAKRICGNCGKEDYKTLPIDPNAHTHSYTVIEEVAATCESNGYVKKQCSCGDVVTETINAKGHNWEHHHEDEIGHKEVRIVCHCGWSCPATGNYVAAFGAHVDSLPEDEKWTHSYYSTSNWVVDVPAKDWDVCTICGASK